MIRFQRIGRRNDPAFRMVVTEKTAGPKAGKFVDLVGTYNPKTKAMTVNAERITHWMGNGAQVSPSLMNLLITKDILKGKKVNVLPKKHPIKKEGEESATPVQAAPAAQEVAPQADAPAVEEAPAEAPVKETPAAEAPAAPESAPAEVAA